jgi:hypothetical protein
LRQTARAAAAEAAQARVRNAQQDYLREELRKDPTLGDPKTALYQDVERLLLSRPVLQTYPEGLRDAVEHVRALHASRRVADLESELGKTKESLAAKEKLLHPSTGEAPAGASGEPKSFGQLPYEERRKRILAELAAAEEHGVSVL